MIRTHVVFVMKSSCHHRKDADFSDAAVHPLALLLWSVDFLFHTVSILIPSETARKRLIIQIMQSTPLYYVSTIIKSCEHHHQIV